VRGLAAAIVVWGAGVVAASQDTQPPRFANRVEVPRRIVDARVLDDMGQPVPGLGADDFSVRIDGRPARVESATWVGSGAGAAAATPHAALPADGESAAIPRGRLIVFLFQKDLEPVRIVGLMRMLLKAQAFLDGLSGDDRVAVLSFDSHLKIWLDFTNDRARLRRVLERGILLESPAPIDEEPARVSLTRRLTQAEGRRTYPIEKGLRVIAEALEPLTGSKSIVLFGHGFGRYGAGGVTMEAEYDAAVVALRESRTSVFSLDVTQADYHSLEAGLKLVSAGTGGFYERTFMFPDRAMRRLTGALAGHYVLIVEPNDQNADGAKLEVKLTRGKGMVLASMANAG
jgi:VWFA-related protein